MRERGRSLPSTRGPLRTPKRPLETDGGQRKVPMARRDGSGLAPAQLSIGVVRVDALVALVAHLPAREIGIGAEPRPHLADQVLDEARVLVGVLGDALLVGP